MPRAGLGAQEGLSVRIADGRAAAEAAARTSMRLPMVMRSTAPDGRTTPRCRGKTDSSDPIPPLEDRMACDPPPTWPGLTESLENRYDLPQIPSSSGESRLRSAGNAEFDIADCADAARSLQLRSDRPDLRSYPRSSAVVGRALHD